MERLLLVRHAESGFSASGLVNGEPSANIGLTPRGEDEARRLGRDIAQEPIDLCVVSSFPRCRVTAELALVGRWISIVEMPDFNEPRYGRHYEGKPLATYQKWAWSKGSREEPAEGESRLAIIGRYSRAYHDLLYRPQKTILAVVHALPIAYLLLALKGEPPRARVDLPVEYATPYPIRADELERGLAVIDAWLANPDW